MRRLAEGAAIASQPASKQRSLLKKKVAVSALRHEWHNRAIRRKLPKPSKAVSLAKSIALEIVTLARLVQE